ncbi:MAG: queuosine precursor transporter [Legionellaceae bacterium]|nr:queuosine precursor transporter [Legionellaceae bacterium]
MERTINFKAQADTTIGVLGGLYVTMLIANLAVGYRYIDLWGIIQSGGIFIFPLSFIISDIVSEKYGSKCANKLTLLGLFCLMIFSLYAFFITQLPAPDFLIGKEKYDDVFKPYLLFAISSLISIGVGSFINIKILSRMSSYMNGGYFALRSFVSSSIGELFVTVISMVIANWTKMGHSTLAYMIACCFGVKTLISFVAIWPAAVVVYFLGNKDEREVFYTIKSYKRPLSLIKRLILISWYAKGYVYHLESINLESKKVFMSYRGTRSQVIIDLSTVVLNSNIISNMSSSDAIEIGFYCGSTGCAFGGSLNKLSKKMHIKRRNVRKVHLKRGNLDIASIMRDGKLNLINRINQENISKYPVEIYRNQVLVDKLDSTQAAYIGCLAGVEFAKKKENTPLNRRLQLVSG